MTSKDAGKPLIPGEVLEVRVHGRGGQGGVTCAKLIAAVYAEMGMFVQTFGDYGSERSGAPVRAYTRVARSPIVNRNKVYTPDHLLVFSRSLMGPGILDGVGEGALVLVNTPESSDDLGPELGFCRLGTVDATTIARKNGIGTSALVIINTTIVGAYARMLDIPLERVQKAYDGLGLSSNFTSAKDAFDAVVIRDPVPGAVPPPPRPPAPPAEVIPITGHIRDIPSPLKTGTWRSQMPRYLTHPAPCNIACPAGNDVVGFIQAVKTDNEEAGARKLLETQPFPAVCGRVCPAFCMEACNRAFYDGSVNIRGLERRLGDGAPPLPSAPPAPARRGKFAVIGGGPAGMSAAWILALRGHDVTVIEGMDRLGGVLFNGIPAYRLPLDVLERDIGRILDRGVKAETSSKVDAARLEKLAAEHDGVIVATGLGGPRKTGAPGEDLRGVQQGTDFLAGVKLVEKPSLQGHAVILGGGNTAVDCARTARRLGASKVTIIYRRGRDDMGAIPEEIDEAVEEGVGLMLRRQPVGFFDDGKGALAGIELAAVEPGPPDESGRRSPLVTDRKSRVDCNHAFLALGQQGFGGLWPEGWKVDGARVLKNDRPTNVWVAGDAATRDGTVAHAIGDGKKAALRMLSLFEGGGDRPDDNGTEETPVTPANILYSHFDPSVPHRTRKLEAAERIDGFDEVDRGLDDTQEADRCFSCGRCTHCDTCLIYCPEGIIFRKQDGEGYDIDNDFCKGCGICVAECPRYAMEMEKPDSGKEESKG